jgi:hypothetical protein
MSKKFNITGLCLPAKHYMADISEKLAQVLALVEEGEYFAISRPRQYGKTTMLTSIARALQQSEQYLVFSISFEGLGSTEFSSSKEFCAAFLHLLERQAKSQQLVELADFLRQAGAHTERFIALSGVITDLVDLAAKRVVLLVDEVDKSSNNQLFLDFLGLLRHKFLNRDNPADYTFHSVVLAGVHDVKTLKAKLRVDEEAKQNSPWNIAAEFKVVMSLLPHEIVPMLEDYAQERGVNLDAPALAERLYYYTSGYPFLVSALCKIVDEEMLPERADKNWHLGDIDEAARRLIHSIRSNTNFDSLIKNLENHPKLYELVYRLAIENEAFYFNIHDPLINLGVLYGILRNGEGVNIHNRIYVEIITNYMASKLVTSLGLLQAQAAGPYLRPGNALDMELVLRNFQQYMRQEHSAKDRQFLERHGRLVFLAFLKPILNSKGHTFKEPQISEERRLDVAVTFQQHKYIVELKIWRGPKAHEEGLKQLADYLDRQGLEEGYLVIFDPRRPAETIQESSRWAHQWIEIEGKRVFAVWV